MYKPLPNERRETREGKGFPANFQILIVEDERLVALDIEDMLRDNGIAEVLWSPSIARAREIVAANENLGAVVLDLKLSDGSGEILIAEFLARGIPVVVITGYPEFRSAVAPVVHKPFASAQLLEALAQVVPG